MCTRDVGIRQILHCSKCCVVICAATQAATCTALTVTALAQGQNGNRLDLFDSVRSHCGGSSLHSTTSHSTALICKPSGILRRVSLHLAPCRAFFGMCVEAKCNGRPQRPRPRRHRAGRMGRPHGHSAYRQDCKRVLRARYGGHTYA